MYKHIQYKFTYNIKSFIKNSNPPIVDICVKITLGENSVNPQTEIISKQKYVLGVSSRMLAPCQVKQYMQGPTTKNKTPNHKTMVAYIPSTWEGRVSLRMDLKSSTSSLAGSCSVSHTSIKLTVLLPQLPHL